MTDDIASCIGHQIRLYRKAAKISLDELAKRINKSKATVSKYENGTIALDMTTLYKIAEALNIDIINIIEYNRPPKRIGFKTSNSFEECDTLYLYHYYEKNYHCSVMRLRYENSTGKIYSTLYYKVSDIENTSKCSCIYHGYMRSYDHIINFVLQNYYSHSEETLLNFFVPANNTSAIVGMMIGIQEKTLRPVSFKVILSKKPLSMEERKEMLLIPKEVIKRLEDDGALIIE